MSGNLDMAANNLFASIVGLQDDSRYIDFESGSAIGFYEFSTQPFISGYLTSTGAAATYVQITNLPAQIVTTNNLSNIAGSGLAVSNNQLVVTNVASGINTAEVESIIAATAITNISDSAFLSRTNPYVTGYFTGGVSFVQSLQDAAFVAGSLTTNLITEASRKYWFVGKAKTQMRPIGLYYNNERAQFDYYDKLNNVTQTFYDTGNFSASAFVTVSSGNTNYWRITTAPTTSTAFGVYGQAAISGTNMYFYNHLSNKWLKVNGTLEW